jgi:uncharacterized YigZ family protein
MTEALPDSYKTLAAEVSHEIKIKGSRFIGLGIPIENEQSAETNLARIHKTEHAATHHCFAWIIGVTGKEFRYSDDGEPSGTAGKPIHQALIGNKLTNVLLVVVRYFGGTKLGTGGLTRAYSRAAAETIERGKIVERLLYHRVSFTIPFSLYNPVQNLLQDFQHEPVDQVFTDSVALSLDIRQSQVERFTARLKELAGGKVDIVTNR